MNHSPRFWKNVELLMNDWKKSKKWLKEYGNVLHSFG
jgi:predicted metal-dependent hydrolase